MTRAQPDPLLKPKLLALSVAACFALNATPSRANPTGPTVVHGSVGFNGLGTSALTITNQAGGNAIINWNGFSIGINELTRFQQFANLAVLNRVTSGQVSSILGSLQSDGRVFLINPNGIVFGASARIDVAGMVASSLNLSDQDFLSNRLRFTEVPGAGAVVNNGVIETATGGRVYLVAPTVENNGLIQAKQGEILLAAGKEVELVDGDSPFVTVKVTAGTEQALNVGNLVAEGGRIGMFGALVRNAGAVEAGGAMVGPGGEIRLVATKDLTLDAGSRVAANGTSGGKVLLQAEGGTNAILGTVEAKGSAGKGGEVSALGVRVGVAGHGLIDASGETGGGTVLVGGDYQGKNAAVQNAERVKIGADGVIRADAMTTGDGGRVIVWADKNTEFYGAISAKGGAQSGNGGFVETSAGENLQAFGSVDVSAPNGKGGTWLLDPTNIDIVAGDLEPGEVCGDSSICFGDVYGSAVGTNAIADAMSGYGFVQLQATNDIRLQASLVIPYYGSLTMQAGNDISLGAHSISMHGNLSLTAADSAAIPYGGSATTGAITSSAGGGNLSTDGGSLNLSGNSIAVGTINTAGNSTGNGGGSVTVSALTGNLSTGNITTGGGMFGGAMVSLTTSTGGNISTGAINTVGGEYGGADININSYGSVSTSSITTGGGYLQINANDSVAVGGPINTSNVSIPEDAGFGGSNGSVFISAENGITTGSITTRGLHAKFGDGGSVVLDTMYGSITVNGSIDTRGANGSVVPVDTCGDGCLDWYYAGTVGGNVSLLRDAQDSFVGTAIQVNGGIDTRGGAGASGETFSFGMDQSGGAGGSVFIGADTCRDSCEGSLQGSVNVTGSINTSGGNGGATTNPFSSTSGSNAGTVAIWASRDVSVTTIVARGGAGGDGSEGGLFDNEGGGGGLVEILSSGAVTIGSIDVSGGRGGNGSSLLYGFLSFGGRGGSGGQVMVSGASITVTNSISARGGSGGSAGGDAVNGYDEASGGDGGEGGTVSLGASGLVSVTGSIDISGGGGGNGGSAYYYASGGSGGWAGSDGGEFGSGIDIFGGSVKTGALIARGGNGGAGGIVANPGGGNSNGGSGGAGGSISVTAISFGGDQIPVAGPIATGLIDASGGAGGNSGAVGTSTTVGGDGGWGGGVSFYGSTIDVAGPILVRGGNGGSVLNGSIDACGGSCAPEAGNGGGGGFASIYGLGLVKVNVGGTLGAVAIDASGGAGGAGSPASSPAGIGGDGGSGGEVMVRGTPDMTLFGSVLANGGAGGAGGAGSASELGGDGGFGGSGGFVFLESSSFGGSPGDGIIYVLAGTQFNVLGGANGAGGASGGAGAGITPAACGLDCNGTFSFLGTIVILDPLSVPEINQGFQQVVEGGDDTTAFVGGEKKDEEEDKSQKELGSCKG